MGLGDTNGIDEKVRKVFTHAKMKRRAVSEAEAAVLAAYRQTTGPIRSAIWNYHRVGQQLLAAESRARKCEKENNIDGPTFLTLQSKVNNLKIEHSTWLAIIRVEHGKLPTHLAHLYHY